MVFIGTAKQLFTKLSFQKNVPSTTKSHSVIKNINSTAAFKSQGNSADIVPKLRSGWPGSRGSISDKRELSTIQCVPLAFGRTQEYGGGLSRRRYNGQGVKLATHLHLVSRLRMGETVPVLPLRLYRCII